MNEAILLSVLGSDETKSLGVVEPLHFSGGTHFGTSSAIGRKCRVAVPIRLLFVRERDDRIFTPENQKTWQHPRSLSGNPALVAQTLRFRAKRYCIKALRS